MVCVEKATNGKLQMRKTILVASTAFLCAGAAWADGMSVGKMNASYDNPATRWSGPYTGAAAGFSFGKVKDHNLELPENAPTFNVGSTTITQSKTINGASYGGYAGYNWVAGSMVYGVETNFNGSTMDAAWNRTEEGQILLGIANDYTYQVEHEVTWYGTAVARLGVAQGPMLIYVNGGAVLGNEKTSFVATYNDTTTLRDAHSAKTHFGWTAGAGFEYSINDILSTRVEFNHIDYSQDPMLGGTDKVDVRFETVKFGVTVRMQ